MKNLKWAVCLCFIYAGTADGQGIMGKIKQKAEQIERSVEGDKKEKETAPEQESQPAAQTRNGKPVNKTGGLVTTPPDVKTFMADAEKAYKAGTYGDARYAVQQAMLGVEMEIGHKILKDLPETVSGLKKVESADQVTSTGYGWAGLTIHREYLEGEQHLTTTIANNAMWMSAVNSYLAAGGHAQSTGGEQKWKHVKVKEHKGIIEYDESSGYKLSVPLGQTSLVVWEGINFANEQDMLKAAATFDIDGIKKTLGEQ